MSLRNGSGRDRAGRFMKGEWKGGPGRPRRAVESHYLLTLADEVNLATWRKIVRAAVRSAVRGDHRARLWLSAYLLGPEPPSLANLAADELAGTDEVEEKVGERRARLRRRQLLDQMAAEAAARSGRGDDR